MTMRADQSSGSRWRGVRWSRRRLQRGSIAVMAAIWVMAAMVVLGAIDVGNLYFQKRDLQRIADMAALAAAQSVDPVDVACASAVQAARSSAGQNDAYPVAASDPVAGTDQITTTCGRWDPPVGGSSSYQAAASNLTQFNAARVTLSRRVQYSFLGLLSAAGRGSPTVSASSTARATAIDSFSISASVASVNSAWLNGILSALLGPGTGLSLDVGDYNALAATNIKLGDLAVALGAGTVSGLVNAGLTPESTVLSGLGPIVIQALMSGANKSQGYALNVASTLAKATIGSTSISLANATNSLLQIGLGNVDSAANASVNLLDLLMTSAMIANYNKGQAVSLDSGVTLPLGATNFTVMKLALQILNPPTLAIGEAGQRPDGSWRTQASSAQIGLYLDIQTPTISLGTNILNQLGLGGLLNVSVTLSGIRLPIYLLVGGPATAKLAATNCGSAGGPTTTTIIATPGLAQLCLSQPLSGSLNLSGSPTCPAGGQISLLNLSASASVLGGLGGLTTITTGPLQISATVQNPVLSIQGVESASNPYPSGGFPTATAPYHFCNSYNGLSSSASCGSNWVSPASATSPDSYWTTATDLLPSLSTALKNIGVGSINVLGISIPAGTLLGAIGSAVLSPILSALGTVVTPLLNLLGVQVGQATVHQISLTCNAAQLVDQ